MPTKTDVSEALPHYSVFADESGTTPHYRCFGIGCVIFRDGELNEFNQLFTDLVMRHGLVGELRWKKIGTSHGAMNMAIDLLKDFLRRRWRFSSIVVWKEKYNNWTIDGEEVAFYKMYTQLLRDRVKRLPGQFAVYFDDRSDSYDRHDEVVHIISNHMLKRIQSEGGLLSVTKQDSRTFPGIQVADLLTGAITASHNAFLDPSAEMNRGKRLLIARLAAVLGWEDLSPDTYPQTDFNIWNFPWQEYRNNPGSREIRPNFSVPYIQREDLEP